MRAALEISARHIYDDLLEGPGRLEYDVTIHGTTQDIHA
jgi:hypothetical protein